MERERREYITGIPEAATGANDFVEFSKMKFNSSADGSARGIVVGSFLGMFKEEQKTAA